MIWKLLFGWKLTMAMRPHKISMEPRPYISRLTSCASCIVTKLWYMYVITWHLTKHKTPQKILFTSLRCIFQWKGSHNHMGIFFHSRIYNGLVRKGVNGEDNRRTWKHPTLCCTCIQLYSEIIWKRRRLIGQHENTQHVALLTSYWYEETETSERLIITYGQDLSYKVKME